MSRRMKLTVAMRDESPMVHFNDPPTYRTVVIELTEEQVAKISPRPIGCTSVHGVQMHESIAYYILEEAANV